MDAFSPDTTRYTLLHADSGFYQTFRTFRSVSITYPVLIANYTPYIAYDANNVYLDLVFPGSNDVDAS